MFVTPADFETVCSAFSTDLVNGDKHQLPPAELRAGKADLSAPELFREGDLSVRHIHPHTEFQLWLRTPANQQAESEA